MIDPHVHCRDDRQSYKDTIRHVFELAGEQGVDKVFDMPNTHPPILNESDIERRLSLVPEEHQEDYFLYMGATSDEEQLRKAVECCDDHREVVGIKLYAGESVGNLSVVEKEEQRKVYKTLEEAGFRGVIAVHCEKEEYMRPELWDPSSPITHARARPKQAEVRSVKDQIELVKETGFKGNLHVVHVSCPRSVAAIGNARRNIEVTCGVTPHHLFWDKRMLKRPDGLLYKMNPPLRAEQDVSQLRRYLQEGKIDWIESDHAPHQIGEKLFSPYSSGFPSLNLYKRLVEDFLPGLGLKKSEIEDLTCSNIEETFKIK